MRFISLLMLCAALTACAPTEGTPQRNPPTVTAPPAFVEAQQPITLDNVANIRYLGRLDQPGALSTVFHAALSPDSTRLVGVNNELLLAWDLLTGNLLFQTARQEVTRVFYAPDKTEIYGVSVDGTTGIYDANSGALRTNFDGHPAYSHVSAFALDDGWLALGGNDGTVKVWDAAERQSLVTFDAHAARVTALAFSRDGDLLATADADGIARVWNWRERVMIDEVKVPPTTSITMLAFAPDAEAVAVGTDQDARLWVINGTGESPVLDTGSGGAGEVLRFSPDGRFLLAGSRSAGLSLWDTTNETLAARLPDTTGDGITAAFSPESSLLITSVLNGKVQLWNLLQVTGETLSRSTLEIGTERVLNVRWADDGRLVLFFDATGPIYLWGAG